MPPDDNVLLPLEELQALGERYSPRVLRQFFQAADSETTPEIDEIKEISNQKLNFIRKSILLNVPSLWVCSLAGALAFAGQPEWTGLQNPTTFESTIESIFPDPTCCILFIYAFLSSILGECISLFSLRCSHGSCSLFQLSLFTMASLLSRTAFIFDVISFVIIAKSAPELSVVGSPMWFMAVCILLLQVRTLLSLFQRKYFCVVDTNPPPPLPARLLASGAPDENNLVALNIPENHVLIASLTQACAVLDYSLLYYVLMKSFVPLPLQPDLFITASCKSHWSCLSHHLLLVPVKYFFLADYGWNFCVVFSLCVSVASSLFACIAHVRSK